MYLLSLSSNENSGLFNEGCKQQNIIVKQLKGSFNLNDFMTTEMNNLNVCDYLAIDLSCLTDFDEQVIQAIVGIQSIYDKLRLIIVATGYETDNPMLGKLFKDGIYNFITATNIIKQHDEVLKCLTTGMVYKDSVKYRPPTNLPSAPSKKVVVHKQAIQQTVSVVVCGTIHRIGTTKQALHITKFLCDSGYKACYVEDNNHEHMDTLSELYDVIEHDGYIEFDGIDIYPHFAIDKLINKRYDFIIYDRGLFEELDKHEFIKRETKIVCAGSLSWESPYLEPLYKEMGDYTDVEILFSFTDKDIRKDIINLMGIYKDKTHFIEYAPRFIDGISNRETYKKIFSQYIEEKGTIIDKGVSGFKNIFQKATIATLTGILVVLSIIIFT